MSSFEEKKREIERVLGVFQNYIEGSELLDVVYSKKFGYVLLGLPAADSIDDSDVTRLEDPETLGVLPGAGVDGKLVGYQKDRL